MDENRSNLTIIAALLGAVAILILILTFVLLYR